MSGMPIPGGGLPMAVPPGQPPLAPPGVPPGIPPAGLPPGAVNGQGAGGMPIANPRAPPPNNPQANPPGVPVSGAQGGDGQPDGGSNAPVQLLPPSRTLYINNLNEKIKETELKKNLTAIFEQFGKILQIVAMKSLHRRGQAWVVFDSLQTAQKALAAMQSFPFCGKPMRINFCKTKSDIVAKEDGTYVPRVKQPLPPLKTKRQNEEDEDHGAKRARQVESDESDDDTYGQAAPHQHPGYGGYGAPPQQYGGPTMEVPNSILFIEGLPEDATDGMLQMLFQQFPGFREVRLVPSRPGIGFVEYSTEMQAGAAKARLNGFPITKDNPIVVTYAKK